MGIMMVAFSWLFAGVSIEKPDPLAMVSKMSRKLVAKTESKNTWQ
jgi:hypothetical protein